MASSNGSSRSVTSLLSQMQYIASSSADFENDQVSRSSLLQLSRDLTAHLETPGDVIASVAYSGVRSTAVRLAIDLQVFDLLVEKSPRSLTGLASASGAEESLIRRILRPLAKMGFVERFDTDSYARTTITKQMVMPSIKAGVRFFADQGAPVLHHAPAYFRANGYRVPQNTADGLFQYAHKTQDDCYTFWSKEPKVMENFNTFMDGRWGTPSLKHWTDWFPIQESCFNGIDTSKSKYAFVDLGGGKGHEGDLLLKKYPETKGEFVLEDFPEAMELENSMKLDPRIVKIAHDFNNPQPIKGARIYFLKNILHNWPTAVCQNILARLREVMVPGYSKILIVNMILKEEDVPLRLAELDVYMLLVHSGAQRSAAQWRELVEGAGLEVTKLWYPPGSGDGVVEVQRK